MYMSQVMTSCCVEPQVQDRGWHYLTSLTDVYLGSHHVSNTENPESTDNTELKQAVMVPAIKIYNLVRKTDIKQKNYLVPNIVMLSLAQWGVWRHM